MAILQWIDHGGLEKRLMEITKRTHAFFHALTDEKRNKD